jgi:hypothetical protein
MCDKQCPFSACQQYASNPMNPKCNPLAQKGVILILNFGVTIVIVTLVAILIHV